MRRKNFQEDFRLYTRYSSFFNVTFINHLYKTILTSDDIESFFISVETWKKIGRVEYNGRRKRLLNEKK